MLRFQKNNVKIILFFMLITSCSYLNKQQKREVEYVYPQVNKFPSVMTEVQLDGDPALLVKLKPESININCNLRNDSPYYWCSLKGELENPDPKLPQKIFSIYHTVMDEKGKNTSLKLCRRLKKANKSVFAILANGVSLDTDDNVFLGKLFGVYNEYECIEVFGNYSLCPKTSKILDIHTGKYIKREELRH